jgi:hypothetical protein
MKTNSFPGIVDMSMDRSGCHTTGKDKLRMLSRQHLPLTTIILTLQTLRCLLLTVLIPAKVTRKSNLGQPSSSRAAESKFYPCMRHNRISLRPPRLYSSSPGLFHHLIFCASTSSQTTFNALSKFNPFRPINLLRLATCTSNSLAGSTYLFP